MNKQNNRRFTIAGVPIDAVSMTEAIECIHTLVCEKRGGTVFTPNVDHVMLARRIPEFAQAYAATELALVDGMPLLWAGRLLGVPVPEKVSGSDLLWPLLTMAAVRNHSVYLLGGAPGSAEIARDVLEKRLPGLRIVGVDAPRIELEADRADSNAVLGRIRAAKPDLLVVGLGAPKQELWLHRNRAALGETVGLGLGACIDFLAARVRRAPPWMSRNGLEWFYRLLQEPKRLAYRYLIRDAGFAWVLLAEMAKRH